MTTVAEPMVQKAAKAGYLAGLYARWRLERNVAKIRKRFDDTSTALYATSRQWDDGILEPTETRQTLGLALAVTAGAGEAPPTKFGVFRM